MTPTIDKRKCPAQGTICTVIPACPTGAVQYEVDPQERLGGRIVIVDELCTECGLCVSVCCGQAIVAGE